MFLGDVGRPEEQIHSRCASYPTPAWGDVRRFGLLSVAVGQRPGGKTGEGGKARAPGLPQLRRPIVIRLGILDFDTSHVVEFSKRLNKKGIAKSQHVDGATVVVGCPGVSKIMPERIAGIAAEMRKLGVPLVEKPTDMIGKVDGVLIESQEGGVHYERARPFLEAGLPCFIDKPFTCSLADAKKIAALAATQKGAGLLVVVAALRPRVGRLHRGRQEGSHPRLPYLRPGAVLEGKSDVPRNPGLYHYGIHAVEVLYTLMGPGCVRVSCLHEKDVDVVTGQWQDGRIATVRGVRQGKAGYGFTAFSANGVRHETLNAGAIYRELLKQIVSFFQTKKAPVDLAVTVEIVAFIEAARSAGNHGAGETVGK